MSHNRHSSSLRRFRKTQKQANARRRKTNRQAVSYEALEPRQLLAGDIGFNFDSQTFGVPGGSPINSAGAVGPAHIIEVTDNNIRIFDKTTGAPLVDKTLESFWTDTGGAGAEAHVDVAGGANADHTETRVVYDSDERRWFMSSISGTDYSSALGQQNAILIAVSRTSNPTEDWTSVLGSFDTDGDPATPREDLRGGFQTLGQSPRNLGMSIDADNLYITVNEPDPFGIPLFDSTYVFNKFNDLVLPTPTDNNMSTNTHGAGLLQWGMDQIGDETGSFGLEVPASGTTINLFEATNTTVPGGVTIGAPTAITVDNYDAPPVRIRQLFDSDLENTRGGQLLTHTVRHGDYLWAVHAINSSEAGFADTSAVRWYQIDVTTGMLNQSGTIEHATENYTYPTIAVTDSGQVAISYTLSGIDNFPSLAMSLGYDNNGVMTFEDPLIVKEGENGYFDTRGNFWGEFQTSIIDADNPETVYVFGMWADASNNGRTQVASVDMVGLSVYLEGDALDNTIIVRRQAADPNNIEVEIDGFVNPAHIYQELNLHSISVDGGGGDDTFIVDNSNGEMDFGDRSRPDQGGIVFIGDGNDQVEMATTERTTWEIGVEGNGIANVGTNLPADCSPQHTDIVTFDLNFEAGSLWFDSTPWAGFADFGEALRTEVTNFYNDVMAPLFTGTFTVSLDINDDETDSFATSAAQGWGYEDVNGTMLYVASPWSILTGNGDRNGAAADAIMAYNLGLDLYGGDRQALLDNITGITRFQTMNILGMESNVENATATTDGIGDFIDATVLDYGYMDLNDVRIVGNQDPGTNQFEVLSYATNASWANDSSGIYFVGIDDSGVPVNLPVNSNLELINFDVLASALAGSSRSGPFDQVIEQDRAFLRGMGYTLNPLAFDAPVAGQLVSFSGVDLIQAGAGEDYFCIGSSNVDLEVRGGDADDYFNITALGIGAVDLHGEMGDDTYQVAFSSAGAITIHDGIGTESDTLIGVGTPLDDHFIITNSFIDVNGGVFAQSGVENMSFDGREGDDIFDIRETVTALSKSIVGGDGTDTFIVNDQGSLPGGNTLQVSVVDPEVDPVDRLQLDLSGFINDTYEADEVENLQVDGHFIIDGTNGTPTVAGGLNLLGDGDDDLDFINSSLDATWTVDGDGSGNVAVDVEPITFVGLVAIDGTNGNNTFNITQTDTDLMIQTNEGVDVFEINNAGAGLLSIFAGDANDIFNIENSGSAGVYLEGQVGDDTYNVNLNNPGGLITIRDSVGSEMDSLSSLGTSGNDHFIFDGGTVTVGSVMIDHEGIENVVYNGMDGDDIFEVISAGPGETLISGGLGNDTFIVSDGGTNATVLNVSVADPSSAPNQIRLDIVALFADTFLADTIENLSVDGTYIIDDVNGIPTVTGGNLNLLGDGNERLIVESALDADWLIDGDGAGMVTINPTITFSGLEEIVGSYGVDTVSVVRTNTDLQINTRSGNDDITVDNAGTGTLTVYGGNDDDTFNVLNSGGGVILDGEAGNDDFTYDDVVTAGSGSFVEDFNSGLPAGWSTIINTGPCGWEPGTEVPPVSPTFTTPGMVFDDDNCGSGAAPSNVTLLSDVYDISGSNATLNYDVFHQEAFGSGESLTVEVWDGALWQQVAFYDVDINSVQTESIDVSAFANADFQARWTYDDNGSWGWGSGVDEFELAYFAGSTPAGFGQLIGGDDNDTFTVLNSGSSTLDISGNGGVDTFNINNPTGMATTHVLGGDGDDLFWVFDSGMGDLTLEGEGDDDTYTVMYVDPTIDFRILDSIGAENDSLFIEGTAGDDTFDINNNEAIYNGGSTWTIEGIENFDFDGLAGDDTFNVDLGNAWSGNLTIRGNTGNDAFNIINSGSGVVELFGESGNDTYTVSILPNTNVTIIDSVGSENDRFFGIGTTGDDIINHAIGTASIGTGSVGMTGIESVEYDGLAGDDTFDIADTATTSTFRGNLGNDTFNVTMNSGISSYFGDQGEDVFHVTETIGGATFFGGDDDDLFNIATATGVNNFFGENGEDVFDVTNHSPLGSSGAMLIDGGANRNQLTVNGYQTAGNMVTVTSTRITGMSGIPIDYTASGSFTVANGVNGITLNGNDGLNDIFEVNSFLAKNSVHMNGFDGNDRFTVRTPALGGVSADGQEGSDLYQYGIGSPNNRFLFVTDTGVVGSDRLVAVLTDNADTISLSGTSFQVDTDNVQLNNNLESMVLNTKAGDDTININRVPIGFVRILAGDGNDVVNVNNFTDTNSMLMDLGDGDDRMTLVAGDASGAITVFGNAGDDTFVSTRAAYTNALFDGQEGSDTYDISILDRSNRFVVARDTGVVGTDDLTIRGTLLDDNLVVRSGIVITPHQDIISNQNTESMTILSAGSDDVISIFGVSSPITNVNTESGEDLVFLNSTFGVAPVKTLNINTGGGHDTVLATGTQADTNTVIDGGVGNDNIMLGSSLANNNGNLDTLFGSIHAIGGSGNDRIYLNDVGRLSTAHYNVGPTFVSNAGPSAFFAGLSFDGTTETLRIDATPYRNHINATPSHDTKFAFYGDGGYNTITLLGDATDGRRFWGVDGGDGFWNFTDGTKDVFFSDFFMM